MPTKPLIAERPDSLRLVEQYRASRRAHDDDGLEHPLFILGSYVWSLRRGGHSWGEVAHWLGVSAARARAGQKLALAHARGDLPFSVAIALS